MKIKRNTNEIFCKYSAFERGDLRRHIDRVHEKIKQHQCNICHMSFGKEGNLKTHVKKIHQSVE
jgi:hypothetical protein